MPPMSLADTATLALTLVQSAGHRLDRTTIDIDGPPLLDYCASNPLTLQVLVGPALRLGLTGVLGRAAEVGLAVPRGGA